MKRTREQIESASDQGIGLNQFGHVRQTDKASDFRPGWLRDEEAGLPLSWLQGIQKKRPWATIANAMSASRPPLAAVGITLLNNEQTKWGGVATLAIAALSDLEGWPARWTGTDDPKNGGRNDAVADGAAAGVIGVGAVAGNIIPIEAMLAIYAPKLVNGINAWAAKREGLEPYTDKVDKITEAGRWAVVGAFAAACLDTFSNIDWTTAALTGTAAVAIGGIYSSSRQIKRRAKALRAKTKSE
jgi:phosphatidylglycerophosphate synthase